MQQQAAHSFGQYNTYDAIPGPKRRMDVIHLNIHKGEENSFSTDLKLDDKVRIDDIAVIKKGTASRWSDEVHAVQSASGKSVTLTDETTHRRDNIWYLIIQS